MPIYTLTLIDTRRVQPYIFGANELQQITGASELVEQATDRFVREALPKPCYFPPDPNVRYIERDNLRAEVIFAGGGNVAILFATRDEAVACTRRYTSRLLIEAPGLEVAVGHVEVNWDQPGALDAAWHELHTEIMPRRKDGVITPQAVGGLGVTAQCAYTGGPAVAEAGDGPGSQALISSEVEAKRAQAEAGYQRLTRLLPVPGYTYPRAFDDLGGAKGRANFIAVIHADGNNMGRRLKAYTQSADNREMANKLRAFSQSVKAQGQRALQAVGALLQDRIEKDAEGPPYIDDVFDQGSASEAESDRRIWLKDGRLPLRPLVFGGDDVTFVCDGRLGLTLAAQFLQAFDDEPLADGQPAFACAGVAMVHTHFPFAQAYALAEELCQAAKTAARGAASAPRAGASLLNWRYATSGLLADWEDICQREYLEGQLIARPLLVAAQNASYETWRRWETFRQIIEQFRAKDWRARRNKLKALRAALRDGPDAVSKFTDIYGPLPIVNGLPEEAGVQQTGWYGGRCVYFDAIEADDLLTCLK